MTAATILERAAADGVTVVLAANGNIKARGDSAALSRWAATLIAHKPEIVAVLQEATNDSAATCWRIVYPGGKAVDIATAPPLCQADVRALYPSAIEASPFKALRESYGGPTFDAWVRAVHRLCELRRDEPGHCQAMIDDFAALAPKSRAAWLGVFCAEIAAIAAVRDADTLSNGDQ